MKNKQKINSAAKRISATALCIITIMTLFTLVPSAGFDGYYYLEDSYTSKPATDQILSGNEWLPLTDYCAFWIAPQFDTPLPEPSMQPTLIASGVGRVVYALYDEQLNKYNIYSDYMPLGVTSLEVRVVDNAYWLYDSNDNTNVIYDIPLTSYLYLYPIAGQPETLWVADETVMEQVVLDASDFGINLEVGWHSYALGGKYMYDYVQPIISEEYERGKADGYQIGFDEGTQTNKTLLDFVSAIFTAPSHLVNTIFDFEIFGFNVANFVKVIITCLVLGFIIKFAIKHGGA